MAKVTALLPCAGQGKRMGGGVSKPFLEVNGRPLLTYTLDTFQRHALINEIILIVQREMVDYCRREIVDKYGYTKVRAIAAGGLERQDSVANGLACVDADAEWVVVHDAVRPLVTGDIITRAVQTAFEKGNAVVGVPVKDTIKKVDRDLTVLETPERRDLWQIQTPQVFKKSILAAAFREAAQKGWQATDDAALVERLGIKVCLVQGDYTNIKVTTPEDLILLKEMTAERTDEDGMQMRVGCGYDVHRLIPRRRLVLGGVCIPYEKGLAGHSDADVLLHAVMDALLGAAALGDIGACFPDCDPQYQDVSSLLLLDQVSCLLKEKGYTCHNLDCTIMAEEPKLAPYREEMRDNLARVLAMDRERIGIKATTTEGLGFTGRKEGIAAQAVCTITGLRA